MADDNWRRGKEPPLRTANVFRLTHDQYEIVEKKAKAGLNNIPKTDGEAYFMTGVQRVLDILKNDITIGT